jgi:hypothetical protein
VRKQLEGRARHSLEYKEHKPIIESEVHSVADYLLGPVDQCEAQVCDLKQLGEWRPRLIDLDADRAADKDAPEVGIGHPAGNRARDVAGRHFLEPLS